MRPARKSIDEARDIGLRVTVLGPGRKLACVSFEDDRS
jgi:hypothetical protein